MSHTDDCLHPIWENDELYFAELDAQEAAAAAVIDNEPLSDKEEDESKSKSRYTHIFCLFFLWSYLVRLLVIYLINFKLFSFFFTKI